MTHKLSEAENQDCRHHPRGSVRRASGFVLTGKQEVGQERGAVFSKALVDTSVIAPFANFLTPTGIFLARYKRRGKK